MNSEIDLANAKFELMNDITDAEFGFYRVQQHLEKLTNLNLKEDGK